MFLAGGLAAYLLPHLEKQNLYDQIDFSRFPCNYFRDLLPRTERSAKRGFQTFAALPIHSRAQENGSQSAAGQPKAPL